MRRIPFLLLPAALFPAALFLAAMWITPLCAEDAPTAPAAPELKGRYEVVDGHRILRLWGTPKERGFAQGYLLAEQILAGVTHDFARIPKAFLDRYEQLLKLVVVPRFKFTPRELEELQGLYDGITARLPAEKRVIPALKRDMELVDLKALNTFGDWYGLGCSSVAVWGELSEDGKPLVGRNFDFPAFDLVLQHQYVAVRAPDGEARGQVGVSYPGCIGTLTGLNAEGVFVAIHDVPIAPTMEKAVRENVPRLLAVRRILEKAGGADACGQAHEMLRAWPTLYGNNLMVVAPELKDGLPCAAVMEYDCRSEVEGGCTLRCADGKAERKDGDPPALCLTCTNHHRKRTEPDNYAELKTRWRYPILSGVGGEKKPETPMGVADMFAWMSKAAFPRGEKVQKRSETFIGPLSHHGTLHQVVAETGKRRLHVRLGVVGKHIRDTEPRAYDVPALLKSLPR